MATELEAAYVQILPSFRGFGPELERGLQREATAMERAGRQAGQAYTKGLSSGSQAPAAGFGSAAGFGAPVEEAGAAGADAAAAFAAGLTSRGAAISAAGTALTTGVTVPLAAVGLLSARAAIGYESAFAGVRKTVDASEGEFDRLSDSIRETANEIPVAREELAKITELGGQFGLPNEDLVGFTRTIADLGVSTNLTTEEGALMAAQFANITKMPTDEFDRFGSTVANLGNNLSTQEDKIVEFGLRLAGQGSIIGLSTDQILAFSAALSSVGIMPEAGGTAFSRVFQRISDAVETGNDDLQVFADTTGLTVEKFEELYRSNPAELINQFVQGLGDVAASGATTPLLEELSLIDVRIRDSLQRLAGSNDLLGRSQAIAAQGWRENIALTEEAEKRYATTESQLQILTNRLGDIGVELGEGLLPAINTAVQGLDPLFDAVSNGAEAFGKLPEGVQQAILVTGLLAAAAGPAAAVLGRVTTALGTIATNSTFGAAGMTRMAAATTAATAASEAYNRSAAARPGGYIPSGPATPPAAGAATTLIAGKASATLLAYGAAMWATSAAVNELTGANDKQTASLRETVAALGSGENALEEFSTLAQERTANWNPLDGFFNPDFIRGRVELDGVEIGFRDVDRAIQQVGESGPEALQELRRQLVAQRSEVEAGSEAWEGLSYAIRQTRVEEGIDPNPGGDTRGQSTGGAIVAANEADQRALEQGADGALRYAASMRTAEGQTERFADSLTDIQASGQFAAVGIDAAAAAAERYRSAVENAGSDDNILSSALSAGAALRGLRVGGGFMDSEEEIQGRARKVAQEQDRMATALRDAATDTSALTDRVRALNPQLEALRITTEAAASAGNAFRESIERSSSLDDIAGSAVSLGDAYKTARKSLRGLPGDLDLAAASLGKLRPRQQRAVEGVLSLGEATTDYLGTLIESGRSSGQVEAEANRLRDAYVAQFRQLGLNEDQIRKYLEAMGLTPEQVSTAIKVSGLEESRAKLESYAALLEGKIPGSVAASVIASVEGGDIEGAAKQLAQFAATNPIDIPVTVEVDLPAITTAQDQLDELQRKTMELPQAYDAVTAAIGGYTDAQQRGLEGLMAAGDAAQDTIAEFIAAGDYDGATAAAGRFRDEFTKILADYGIVGDAANTYIDDLLQLSTIDVETNIKLSGIEDALTQIGLYNTILQQTGTSLPADVAKMIAENLQDRNYEGVATILEQFTAGELGIPVTPVTVPVQADVQPATTAVEFFRVTEEGKQVAVPADAVTTLAEQGVSVFRVTEEGTILQVPVSANTKPATTGVQAFRDWVSTQEPAVMRISARLDEEGQRLLQSVGGTAAFGAGGYGSGKSGSAFVPRGWYPNGGRDNDPSTPYATGGYVSGPGTGTSDSIKALLSNGEFVMRARAVDEIGVDALSAMNESPQMFRWIGDEIISLPSTDMPKNFDRRPGGTMGQFYYKGQWYDDEVQQMRGFASGGYTGPGVGPRSLGVDYLDKLNKGYVPSFASGDMVAATPAPAGIGRGGARINYSVTEAKSRPTPEDLLRVTNSGVFLGVLE